MHITEIGSMRTPSTEPPTQSEQQGTRSDEDQSKESRLVLIWFPPEARNDRRSGDKVSRANQQRENAEQSPEDCSATRTANGNNYSESPIHPKTGSSDARLTRAFTRSWLATGAQTRSHAANAEAQRAGRDPKRSAVIYNSSLGRPGKSVHSRFARIAARTS